MYLRKHRLYYTSINKKKQLVEVKVKPYIYMYIYSDTLCGMVYLCFDIVYLYAYPGKRVDPSASQGTVRTFP